MTEFKFKLKPRCIWNDSKKIPPPHLQPILVWKPSLDTSETYIGNVMEYIPKEAIKCKDSRRYTCCCEYCEYENCKEYVAGGWWWYYEDAGRFYYWGGCHIESDLKYWLPLPTGILIEGIDDDE